MKAMILAAGLGTRLGVLTRDIPKCLVEVAGKPMIVHVVEHLRAAGVTTIVINLHYLADKVRDYFAQHNFGVAIEFIYEPEILGTGGAIKNARKLLQDEPDFIVYNTDVYSDLDLGKFVEAHRSRNALVTLAVMDRPTSRPLLFDPTGQLVGWESGENKDQPTSAGPVERLNFSGIQIISSGFFNYLEVEQGAFSSIRPFLAAAKAGQRVFAFRIDASYWIDMGTPEKLEELRHKVGQ